MGDYSETPSPNLVRRPILWRIDEPGWTDLATTIGMPANYSFAGVETISDSRLAAGIAGAVDYANFKDIAVVWDLDAGTVRNVHPEGLGYNSSWIREIRDDRSAVGLLRLIDGGLQGEVGYYWSAGTLPGRVLPPDR